jgi:hypothetical protein
MYFEEIINKISFFYKHPVFSGYNFFLKYYLKTIFTKKNELDTEFFLISAIWSTLLRADGF